MRSRLWVVLCVVAASFVPGAARAEVPEPTVSGPVTGGVRGHALFDSWFDPSAFGYTEDEFFVSGTASNVAKTASAPYTTRVIVMRPVGAETFNGTALLDWTNVTAQFENAVDSLHARDMLLREGFMVVHASVQLAGICCTPLTPKIWDPVRYAPLSHPGDDYSFDIFSQIAKALKTNAFARGSGLVVRRVLAAGQSQSAGRLNTYVRRVQPAAGVIDGFLIHGGGSKTWGDAPPAVPVLHLLSDAEANPTAPDTDVNYRLWEIAGTAHSDFWLGYNQVFGQGPRTLADAPQRPASDVAEVSSVAGNYGEIVHPMDATCILAGATMPMRYATSAAIHHLNVWAGTGRAPASGPRYAFSNGVLARDALGNALGGIRLPPVDVPVARYVSTACGLGGFTIPMSDVELLTRYPTHAGYYAQMASRTADAVAAGWLLEPDAADLLSRACAARTRWHESGPASC